ncbi:MAG TPA: hypothetical protein OIL76_09875 [Veillonellaceae bacterium]|nr:hypothetical protein [Veillonellaceae bacterium]
MENDIGYSTSRWQKIISFLFVIFPILDIYSIGIKGIGVGSIILCFAIVGISIRFLSTKHSFRWNLYYVFFLYGLCISLITLMIHSEFSATAVIIRLTYFIFYTLLIFLPSDNDFNAYFAAQVYLRIGMLVGGFLVLQYILFLGVGYNLFGLIPGVPLNYTIEDYSKWVDSYNSMYSVMFRPASLFTEPASLAQYLSPLLILVLFTKIGECKKLLKAFFITVVMILSTSTNGLILAAFTWMTYLTYKNIERLRSWKLPIIFVLSFIVAITSIMLILFTDNPVSDYAAYKFRGLAEMDVSSSSYLRIMRGFDIYGQLNIFEKIFGIGMGTYKSYYDSGALTVFDGETEYMSSLSYLFVSVGIIGVLLYISSLLYNVYRKGITACVLASSIILSFISSSLFNTPVYVLSYLFLLHMNRKSKIKKTSL